MASQKYLLLTPQEVNLKSYLRLLFFIYLVGMFLYLLLGGLFLLAIGGILNEIRYIREQTGRDMRK